MVKQNQNSSYVKLPPTRSVDYHDNPGYSLWSWSVWLFVWCCGNHSFATKSVIFKKNRPNILTFWRKRTWELVPSPCSTILPTVGYEVPDGPEEEPCDSVGHDEDEERAAPVEVHQRGEDVGQVAVSLLHVTMLHVAAAVLLHVALPLTSSSG